MREVDLVVVGGGPAGMAAAVSAYESGLRDILILERDERLGGILQQCIHNGFGLHRFNEELTGPEYAYRYEALVREYRIPYLLNTMAVDITASRTVTAVNSADGVFTVSAKAVVLAMGCRERSRGALNIPGSRPAGVYTAGTAQRFVNIKGLMPGKRAVILGSGDIGLIMARRMTLEGATVAAVCELLPYSGGLTRNIVQCLNDYDIPLLLSHTITEIHGGDRVTGVTISRVGKDRRPVAGTQRYVECDTVLLSVGLLPENELTKKAGVPLNTITGGAVVNQRRETQVAGIFSCGNVLHVHDLVDFVSEESELAGKYAADYAVRGNGGSNKIIEVKAGRGVRYTVPQRIALPDRESVKLFFRVTDVFHNVTVRVTDGQTVLFKKKRVKVAPGEMENAKLSAASLARLTAETLTVELSEE